MAVMKQLGQTKDGTGDTWTQLYQVGANKVAMGMILFVCNVTDTADDFSISHDNDGTTHTDATALYLKCAIAANSTQKIYLPPINNSSGAIAIKSTTANAVTFTLYGTEETLA